MNKFNKIFIILIVIVCLIGIIGIKGGFSKIWEKESSISENGIVIGSYENIIKNNKKPTIIVFSYDADCCPSTKKFFDDYNEKINKVAKGYKEDLNFIFINTGTVNVEDKKQIIKIAERYDVEYLPSIVLLNNNGESLKVIVNDFEEEELHDLIRPLI
ncbi:Thioredoxin [Geosporobacter subterraneus DSM 17957]|uniref:Thioredoxin n=1 Tax=Geosporobacter subterraneus DSM 17957 TaxID=1121919 RepID=A0A1M6PXB2_9FIRM|nr:thioredoxin fold domain-containing protein [Geosporobacter subterraneus]SHK12635.1 Thioredoxin [Geosporobacter subterraneus DSM 17957]